MQRSARAVPSYVSTAGLQVASELHRFLAEEALPGSGVEEDIFWESLASMLARFGPRNNALLARRAGLQTQIDRWHQEHRFDPTRYRNFLEDIGYLISP